jgi:heptosyltransferase-2/heptosyltransferase-3
MSFELLFLQFKTHYSKFKTIMKRFLRLALLHLLACTARPFVRRPRGPIGAVLYLKPDHLGDLLLATPALSALRQSLPGAQITALIGPWSEMILRRNPDIDALLTCPYPGFARATTDHRAPAPHNGAAVTNRRWSVASRLPSIVRPYLTLLRYALLLRAQPYDAAIVGRDDHWWGAALALLAGVPIRIGFAVPECRPFLTTALPWNPEEHVTRQGLALVQAIDKQRTSLSRHLPVSPSPGLPIFPAARFDLAPADLDWAGNWLREQRDGPFVVLHPGTAGPDKLWFPERWAAVADALQRDGAQIVLTGGPDEQALVAAVAAYMATPARQLAGKTSIGQLAALLRQAELVLGVDSGPLHLAAAQGTRTLHLYGPGDAGRFGPWGDPARHVVVREELWCSPCGVFGACPRGLARPECMERIAVTRVVGEARRLLATARAIGNKGNG